MTGCGNDKTVEQPAPPAQAEQKNFYSNGQFKVGADITAGEYIAVGTGYVEVAKDSSGDLKLYPAVDAPKVDTSGTLPSGQYKAGVDIAAGEYKMMADNFTRLSLTDNICK